MPKLTIFSAPKSFSDSHIHTIQCNAIQSWVNLGPEVEVLLVGDEAGMEDVAREFGVCQLKNVKCNPSGTPLVSSIFELARQASQSPLLAYVNADILLMPDFVQAVEDTHAQYERFVLLSQRWDLDVRERLDFSPNWEQRLRTDVLRHGQLHLPAGSDFFVFPRNLYSKIPEFAIGRAGWDNWMIYHARQKSWPVVDATPSVMVIHQDHDYRHLAGGLPHYMQPESKANEDLAGGFANLFMILDSDKQLVDGIVRAPRWTRLRLLRRIETLLTPKDGRREGLRWSLARKARRMRRRITGSL